MKETIKKYVLIKWWIPLFIFVLGALIFVTLLSSTNDLLISTSDYFLLISIILLLVAGIWQLFKGKWYLGIFQLGVLFAGTVWLTFIATFMSMFGPDKDTFADNLAVPENIEFEYPIDLPIDENFESIHPDSLNLKNEDLKFQLYNSFQPGLYEYDVWISSENGGVVYLKAFEITQEIELSKSRLKERSTIRIDKTNGKIQKFGTSNHFTIYEGDWVKPYGARFEVWFRAENQNEEVKLFEKNYVIEGWMR